MRQVVEAIEHEPVLVTVRYHVRQRRERAFVRAMEAYGRIRHRDGASWWGVFRDLEHADVFLETFYSDVVGRTPTAARALYRRF
jgi:hypothetical protein